MDWIGLVPILVVIMAAVGFAQAAFLSHQMRKEIQRLEHQLNSNMEREMANRVKAAVIEEQLRAQTEKR